MFIKMNSLKIKLRNLMWKLFLKLENNNNIDFNKNGERFFIEQLLYMLSKKSMNEIVIFDIGANVGNYTKVILNELAEYEIKYEIHLFEPAKSCFNELVSRYSHFNYIFLNNFGASSKNQTSIIYYDQEKSGLASLYNRNLEAYHLALDKTEYVELQKLSSYIEEQKITHIDFIKIDIEGHELKAFEGFESYMNSSFIDYIQFEYGGSNLDSHTSLMELYAFFKERDFSIAKLMPNGLLIRDYQPWMDNFVYSNYVAISNKVINQ